MIYNKIFVMKKLLTIISAHREPPYWLFQDAARQTCPWKQEEKAGNEGEQTVEIVPAEGSVNLDEFSDYIVSVEDDAIWFHPTEEGTGETLR